MTAKFFHELFYSTLACIVLFCMSTINSRHINPLLVPHDDWVQEQTKINSTTMLNYMHIHMHSHWELILELSCIQTTTCWCLSVSCWRCDTEEAPGASSRKCAGVWWKSSLLGEICPGATGSRSRQPSKSCSSSWIPANWGWRRWMKSGPTST